MARMGAKKGAKQATSEGVGAERAEEMLRTAGAVMMDVDSSVCIDEGIDELADWLGKREDVEHWTTKAMEGEVTFEEALAARLGAMRPSKKAIDDLLSARPPRFSSGVIAFAGRLRERGTEVFLVSGGFEQMLRPVADALQVPYGNIIANRILFDEGGNYTGYDDGRFTSRSGGKQRAAEYVRTELGYSPVVMIGDGMTDLEARGEGGADCFIGFGGVKEREAVRQGSDLFVYDFWLLADMLK